MGKINYTDKRFSYIRKGVKYGVPPEIKHKGITYKFATALHRVAIELHDAGKQILCLRTMKTPSFDDARGYWQKFPTRLVLEELYYSH